MSIRVFKFCFTGIPAPGAGRSDAGVSVWLLMARRSVLMLVRGAVPEPLPALKPPEEISGEALKQKIFALEIEDELQALKAKVLKEKMVKAMEFQKELRAIKNFLQFLYFFSKTKIDRAMLSRLGLRLSSDFRSEILHTG